MAVAGVGLWWVLRKRYSSVKASTTILDDLLNADYKDPIGAHVEDESIDRDSNGDLVVGDIMAMAMGGGFDYDGDDDNEAADSKENNENDTDVMCGYE